MMTISSIQGTAADALSRALSQALQASAPSSREFRVLLAFLRRLARANVPDLLQADEHDRPMRLSLNGLELTITCSCGSHVRFASQTALKRNRA